MSDQATNGIFGLIQCVHPPNYGGILWNVIFLQLLCLCFKGTSTHTHEKYSEKLRLA